MNGLRISRTKNFLYPAQEALPARSAANILIWVCLILALFWCGVEIFLFANHLASPELTRGNMIEGVYRIQHQLPLYPPPSIEYIPLSYNPLFYFLGSVLASVLGLTASTLRFEAILGTFGIWLMIYLIVHKYTKSHIFAVISVGLFAGAYLAFDGYLDYAQPDSWMIFISLLALHILDTPRSWRWNIMAMLLLFVAFMFKQHAVLFMAAGLLYLTWNIGIRRSIPYWIVAACCWIFIYFLLGPTLFGSYFIYFTYTMPSTWSLLNAQSFERYGLYVLRHFPLLTGTSLLVFADALFQLIRSRVKPNIWVFSLPFAFLVSFLGTLDAGSENNNFISLGVWVIIVGTIALVQLLRYPSSSNSIPATVSIHDTRWNALIAAVLALSFVIDIYNPISAITSPRAWTEYNDLISEIKKLDGVVYIPSAGQLAEGYRLPVVAHEVTLEDMIRGADNDTRNNPFVMSILKSLMNPTGNAYIFTDRPLEDINVLNFLTSKYTLLTDYGNRFKELKAVPGRWSGTTWMRYLYAYKRP